MTEPSQQIIEQTFKSLIDNNYKIEAIYTYTDKNGNPIYWKIRFSKDNQKEIRPLSYLNNRWHAKEPLFTEGKPLYNQDKIVKDNNSSIWFVEGEKCADALTNLGLVATTSGSTSSADYADLNILKKKHVIVWPDNDSVGNEFATSICEKLLHLGCEVEMIDIDQLQLPEKGDCVDWLNQNSTASNETLNSLPKKHFSENDLWPEPEKITNTLKEVFPCSVHLLPEKLQPWVKDVAFRMQCPIDFLAIGCIVMIGSLIGCSCGIKPKQNDDWVIVPNLWGIAIGRPSVVKKTPALSEAISPLKELEKNSFNDYEKRHKDYELATELHEVKKSALKNELKKNYKNNNPDILDRFRSDYETIHEPKKPILKRYRTEDITIEKISELLTENPQGILIFRDELVGLLASWDKIGHENDRSFYLESWNGIGAYTTDRISRGSLHVEHLCLSLLGTTQPDKLVDYLYQCIHGLNNDGLIQRFQLAVYPDEPKHIKKAQETDKAPNEHAKEIVMQIVNNIESTDFSSLGLPLTRGIPCFSFNDEAQDLMYQLLDEIDNKIRLEENPFIAEHLGKYKSLLPALVLIFHITDSILTGKLNQEIDIDSLVRANCFCNYLETHARRIYGLIEDISIKGAKILAEKIKKRKLKNKFTLRDIYRNNWRFLNTKELARKACDELVDADWLKQNYQRANTRQKEVYIINPKIYDEKIYI